MNPGDEVMIQITYDDFLQRFNIMMDAQDLGIEFYVNMGESMMQFTQLSVVGGIDVEWSGFIPRGTYLWTVPTLHFPAKLLPNAQE